VVLHIAGTVKANPGLAAPAPAQPANPNPPAQPTNK